MVLTAPLPPSLSLGSLAGFYRSFVKLSIPKMYDYVNSGTKTVIISLYSCLAIVDIKKGSCVNTNGVTITAFFHGTMAPKLNRRDRSDPSGRGGVIISPFSCLSLHKQNFSRALIRHNLEPENATPTAVYIKFRPCLFSFRVTVPPCHGDIMSRCHRAIMSLCRRAIVSPCYRVTVPSCHRRNCGEEKSAC